MKLNHMICYRPLNLDAREKVIYLGPRPEGGISLSLVFDGIESARGWNDREISEIVEYLDAFSKRGYILAFCDSPQFPDWRQSKYLQLKEDFMKRQLPQS